MGGAGEGVGQGQVSTAIDISSHQWNNAYHCLQACSFAPTNWVCCFFCGLLHFQLSDLVGSKRGGIASVSLEPFTFVNVIYLSVTH